MLYPFALFMWFIHKRGNNPKFYSPVEQISKQWCIQTMKCYSAIKRNQVLHRQQHGWTSVHCAEGVKPDPEGCIRSDSFMMTFPNRQNWRGRQSQWLRIRAKVDYMRDSWGWRNCSCLDCVDGYIRICICQTHGLVHGKGCVLLYIKTINSMFVPLANCYVET